MKAKEAKKNASTASVTKKDKFVGNAAGATVSANHLRRPPATVYINATTCFFNDPRSFVEPRDLVVLTV